MLAPVLLAALVMIESPAASGAAEPHLTSLRDGGVVMSWIEPGSDKKHALKFSMYRKGKWSAPRVIVERADLVANWADFPSIVEDRRGTLFAHWLQKSAADTHAYDVWITSSRDYGKSWKKPRILHTDRKPGEHGFVSMVPLAKGGVAVAWLDSREMSGDGHHGSAGAMTLRYTEVDSSLAASTESLLDARVCECCTTGMAMTARGPLVVYRDRSNEEIRDISFVRKAGAKSWSAPSRIHADGWKIEGCPVNGPQVDARGETVGVAWFNAANDKAEVNVVFSKDAGATFGKALCIDGGQAIGRVDLLMLDDGSALVMWVEGMENASLTMRRVRADGRMDAPQKIGPTSSSRGSGFPRATLDGKAAWIAWTDLAAKKIRVAKFE